MLTGKRIVLLAAFFAISVVGLPSDLLAQPAVETRPTEVRPMSTARMRMNRGMLMTVGCSASCGGLGGGGNNLSCSANGAGATCTKSADPSQVVCTDGTNTTTCPCAPANAACTTK